MYYVRRTTNTYVDTLEVGDQFMILADVYGVDSARIVWATCQRINEDGAALCLCNHALARGTHEEAEDFCRRFPEMCKVSGQEILSARLLTYGEVFGHDDFYREYFYGTDNSEQLPLFKTRADRLADYGGETWWWWLANPVVGLASHFALVNGAGYADSTDASYSRGIRPAFTIRAN